MSSKTFEFLLFLAEVQDRSIHLQSINDWQQTCFMFVASQGADLYLSLYFTPLTEQPHPGS